MQHCSAAAICRQHFALGPHSLYTTETYSVCDHWASIVQESADDTYLIWAIRHKELALAEHLLNMNYDVNERCNRVRHS